MTTLFLLCDIHMTNALHKYDIMNKAFNMPHINTLIFFNFK